MTGLLKCIAIELKIASSHGQLKQFEDLCKILLDVGQTEATLGGGQHKTDNVSVDLSHYYSMSMHNTTVGGLASVTHDATATGGTEYKKHKKSNDSKLLICHLLDCLDFETQQLDKPRWDYFDNIMMQKLLHSCEVMAPSVGRKLIDIKKLQDILKDELNSIQTTIATGQRQHILQEIESVLVFALQLNSQKTMASSTIRFMEAWGQVVEILFTVAPVSSDLKQSLILEIIQALLNRIPPMEIMTELADLASSTVFLLLVNLRHCTTFKSCSEGGEFTLKPFVFCVFFIISFSQQPIKHSPTSTIHH
jgi:nuclear pore complex protein Nup205